jgi:hypothetical protein
MPPDVTLGRDGQTAGADGGVESLGPTETDELLEHTVSNVADDREQWARLFRLLELESHIAALAKPARRLRDDAERAERKGDLELAADLRDLAGNFEALHHGILRVERARAKAPPEEREAANAGALSAYRGTEKILDRALAHLRRTPRPQTRRCVRSENRPREARRRRSSRITRAGPARPRRDDDPDAPGGGAA